MKPTDWAITDDEDEFDRSDDTFLVFAIDIETYALAIDSVREIIRLQDIISVPQMPAHIKGVINLRGRIIPVMDLRARFRMPSAEISERTVLIVIEVDDEQTALLVDAVKEVTEILPESMSASSRRNTSEATIVKAIAQCKDKVHIVLDLQLLVSEDYAIDHQELEALVEEAA